MAQPIRIVVADDHRLFRQGLKSLIESEDGISIAAETDRAEDLAAVLDREPCDVLVLDLQMERNTLPLIEALTKRVPVIVLTASEIPADAIAAIRNGARAVVFKRFAIENLVEAIRTVAAGNVWMPPELQTQMAEHLRRPTPSLLSPREEDVVRCVVSGKRNAEIARELEITEETVKTHLNRIFRKLGVRDRVELVLYATRGGGGDGPRRA